MTRRIISVALIVLGLAAVLAAIASATIWRPTDTATLSLPSRPDTPVVITDPGVLDAVDPDVTVRATAPDGEPVTLAVGRTADVEAWLADAPHQRVTGLASWEELEVTSEAGSDAGQDDSGQDDSAQNDSGQDGADDGDQSVPDPSGSDLWVTEETGTGNAELEWSAADAGDGRWSLLAATDGTEPAPNLTLTWSVEPRTPWLVPGIIAGAVLILIGLGLLVLQAMTGRRQRERAAAVAARSDETAVLTAVDEPREHGRHSNRPGRRRRGRRAAEEDATSQDRTTAAPRELDDAGVARGAGIVPASATASEHRAQREPEPAAAADADAPESEQDTATTSPVDDTVRTDESAESGSLPETEVAPVPDETTSASGWRALWGFGGSAAAGQGDGEAGSGQGTDGGAVDRDTDEGKGQR